MPAPVVGVPMVVSLDSLVQRFILPNPHVNEGSGLNDSSYSANWNNFHGKVNVQLISGSRTIRIFIVNTSD
jgi:hypothetical protein